MRTWLLLFFSAFTLGFCLSYLVTTSASQSPVAINLKVSTDERGAIKVLAGEGQENYSPRRHTSFNKSKTASRVSRALPKAYAGASERLITRRAVPMLTEAGPATLPGLNQPPAAPGAGPAPLEKGRLAGKLLDAARYELAGKTGQRDLILASIFQEVIRARIGEPAGPDTRAPARQLPPPEHSPAKEPPAEAPPTETAGAAKPALLPPAPPAVATTPAPAERIAPAAPTAPIAPAARKPGRKPAGEKKIESPAAAPPGSPGIRLVNVTFVKNLRGLRDFDPCPNIFSRGEKIQFKAEFEGLQEQPSGTEEDRTYTRRFSASWKLTDAHSEVIDTRTFIAPRSIVYRPRERDNILMVFDTCELPNTLTPGKYQLLVEGKDLIAGKETVSILDLQVRKSSSLFSPAPAKLDTSDLEIVPPYVEPPEKSAEERKATVDSP